MHEWMISDGCMGKFYSFIILLFSVKSESTQQILQVGIIFNKLNIVIRKLSPQFVSFSQEIEIRDPIFFCEI